MVNGGALLPEEAKIYVVPVTSTVTSTYAVTAEVTNFSESGGEEELESRQTFGNGNIDLIKPRTQIEVSFDVIMRYGSNVTKWDAFKWGAGLNSAGNSPSKQVIISWTDGTTNYTRAYNNARGFSFEPSSAADGLLEGTITFKLSPTTAEGAANFKITSTVATSVTWS